MASHVYPDYAPILKVYEADNTTARTDVGVSGNITTMSSAPRFTLSADGGCGNGSLILRAVKPGTTTTDITQGYALNLAEVVQFIPDAEEGTVAWYSGAVVGRSRGAEPGLHRYELAGLSNRLAGLPPVPDGEIAQFGNNAPASGTYNFNSRYYVSSGSNLGIVQWLLAEPIADGASGTLAIDTSHPDYDSYANQTYTTDTHIQLAKMEYRDDVALLLTDLALMCPDAINTPVWPCYWGVKADSTFYFKFRPDLELGRVVINTAAASRGQALLTLNSVKSTYDTYAEQDVAMLYNVLQLTGGLDNEDVPFSKTYTDTDSIAKYKRYRADAMEAPWITDAADGDHYAAGYFGRYADPVASYWFAGVKITSAAHLPLPWDGYIQIQDGAIAHDSTDPKLSLLSVTVDFGETPIAALQMGEGIGSRGSGIPTSQASLRSGSANRWKAHANKAGASHRQPPNISSGWLPLIHSHDGPFIP